LGKVGGKESFTQDNGKIHFEMCKFALEDVELAQCQTQ
jgi:hypothetical protein